MGLIAGLDNLASAGIEAQFVGLPAHMLVMYRLGERLGPEGHTLPFYFYNAARALILMSGTENINIRLFTSNCFICILKNNLTVKFPGAIFLTSI